MKKIPGAAFIEKAEEKKAMKLTKLDQDAEETK